MEDGRPDRAARRLRRAALQNGVLVGAAVVIGWAGFQYRSLRPELWVLAALVFLAAEGNLVRVIVTNRRAPSAGG